METQVLSADDNEEDDHFDLHHDAGDHIKALQLNVMDDDNKCYENEVSLNAADFVPLFSSKSQSLPFSGISAVMADERVQSLRSYLEYQQETIQAMRSEINDTYKPLLLDNKELELNLQSLVTEIWCLKQENQTLSREVREYADDLKTLQEGVAANEHENEFHRQIGRQMSSSFIEIQEDLSALRLTENDLRLNFRASVKRSADKNVQNESLQRINEQCMAINERLRTNVDTLKLQLSEQHQHVREQTEDINQLKLQLFEKTQSFEQLTKTKSYSYNTAAFFSSLSARQRRRSKDEDLMNVLRVASVRSAASTTTETAAVAPSRSASVHNADGDRDCWNELLLSPGKYGGDRDAAVLVSVSAATTPMYGPFTPLFTEGDSLQRVRRNSKDSQCAVHDSLDTIRNEYIQISRKDLNDLQEKYDTDIANLQMKIAAMAEKPQSKQCSTRSMATQTKPPKTKPKKTLGFWERCMADFRCFPLDEKGEY